MDAQPDEPQAVRGIRPRPGLALALIFVATVLFQLPFFDLWFSLMDEGHVLQFADLRLRGGEFYRDATFYPLPGAFHFLALVFDVFGASILVSRWVVILEFAEPRNPLIRWGNRFYTMRVMPWTASMVARDGSGAYRYLPRSIETFLDPEQLAELMRGAGLVVQRQVPLTFGVCVASLGVREP